MKGVAKRGQEHRVRRGINQRGPAVGKVPFDPLQGAGADRDDPVLAPLALANRQQQLLTVEVVEPQGDQFTAADCRGIECLQDCPVPDTDGGLKVHHRVRWKYLVPPVPSR